MSDYTGAAYNRHTIRKKGEGQVAGNSAEQFFAHHLIYFGIPYQWVGSKKLPWDFVIPCRDIEITVDVKAKERNVFASAHWSAHVPLRLRDEDGARIYVFASVNDGHVQLCGWMGKQEFWKAADIVTPGQVHDGRVEQHSPAGKLKYSAMREMTKLWSILKGVQ